MPINFEGFLLLDNSVSCYIANGHGHEVLEIIGQNRNHCEDKKTVIKSLPSAYSWSTEEGRVGRIHP